ncbi:MAG: hypothetical protein CL800_09510 [Citromicrobium sp.]|uniref:Uncharacterized protein n=1 Tax=Novosphingobium silvae TaxID=2692619 RepID=A0A7X4GJQ4_9SPHN|nr:MULTISPECIES: hypothetical protein [Sphingomonadaceae]MAL27792.1 hypothetical protein [Croceicoccus sp.]MBL4793709.1 hypothetical protein [Citromicrobium sp.]MCC4254649.1 hypothetical protein [Sphingobium naphthae]MEC7932961.1 hypothetical protein [Pseudomonadota bacterium]HAV81327.1 hypothetical protein [Erythrobacter sp.]
MRVAALCLFLLVSACGLGETSPSVVEQTQDGVTALVRNDVQESEDGLVVSDAIERHGFVRRQGSCLVVDYSGQEYSPVFRTPATFDATLQSATAKPSAPLQLLGGPLSKVRRGFSEELAEFCGRPLFLLVGITPSVFHNPVVPGKAR